MHKLCWFAFMLLLGADLTVRSLAEYCVPIEGYKSCACKLNETKQVFNLVPLAPKNVSGRPRFTANQTTNLGWHYSYNPCDGFDLFVNTSHATAIPCLDVSVATWTKSPPHQCVDLGDPKSAVFDYSYTDLSKYNLTLGSNLSVTFTSLNDTSTKNQAVIYLVCNSNMTYLNESVFKYLTVDTKSSHTRYYFALESRCGCPGLCGTPPKKGSSKGDKTKNDDTWLIIGVSIGAIVILLLVVLAVICCRTKRSGYTSI